ncbi:MAG: tetratricopeptide repeat protein [Gammaproteobacteria bacterium]
MKKVCIRLILVALSFGMVSVYASLEDAQRLYEQGRSSEALAKVNDLLADKPKNAELRFLKGIIFAESGDADKAIETFASLTQDYPELPEPWNNLAVLFAERGEFDKSREALLAAIQTHPSYSTAHENLGDLYARMAGMAYDRALEQDRANDSARLKLSAVNGLFAVPGVTDQPVLASTSPEPPRTVPATRPNPRPRPAPVVEQPVVASTAPPPEPAPEPVVTQPVVTQPVVTEPASPNPLAVETAIRGWANAWASQDVEGYLARYSPTFRPSNGASYAAWASYRRDRLTKPSVIEVELSDIQVDFNSASSARAMFKQKYRSDNYRDEVIKELVMIKSDGQWRIVSEVSQ